MICRRYDEAAVYHDGKWVMFEPKDSSEFDQYMKLLAIKRKPNRDLQQHKESRDLRRC